AAAVTAWAAATMVHGAALPLPEGVVVGASSIESMMKDEAIAAATLPSRKMLRKRGISGLNNYNCKLTPAHPRPLLLVHATLLTEDSWWTFAPVLIREGYCVFALTYGRSDNIPFVGGVAPIEDSAQELATFADNILKRMNVTQLDYVGHSQGGILGRYWMKYLGGAGKVN
ncbi:hypothetical protein BX616_006203, partial [Lobosporangium transversale]